MTITLCPCQSTQTYQDCCEPFRTCIHNVFALKNEINRQLFKEKTQIDSHSIKQVFDEEKQDLAPVFYLQVMQKQNLVFKFYNEI